MSKKYGVRRVRCVWHVFVGDVGDGFVLPSARPGVSIGGLKVRLGQVMGFAYFGCLYGSQHLKTNLRPQDPQEPGRQKLHIGTLLMGIHGS